jgi:hypothetical protein
MTWRKEILTLLGLELRLLSHPAPANNIFFFFILWVVSQSCEYLEYIVLNGRVTDKSEGIWKEAVMA